MSGHLAGRAIVVTGAGQGLGRAYAVAAAQEGARVIVNDVDEVAALRTARLITDAGDQAEAVCASVADWAGAEFIVDSCVQTYGRLDGLVNNAGLFHVGPAAEESESQARAPVEVNVLGALYCGIHAMRRMTAQASGSIVNVTSGAHLGLPSMSTYGATKGAVASMTYGWALDVAGTGVRVNAVSPVAGTRMTDSVGADRAELPKPCEIAPLVVYLLSDLSAARNGQVLRHDGTAISLLMPAAFGEPLAAAPLNDAQAIADALDSALAAR
jgi:NAD(P)-dependent dehydrogenase (short-subunit alcohol dehydrogenase family)